MAAEAYKARFCEEDSPGWQAIDARLAEIYGPGAPDFHFGTMINYALGGPDPIDGVSVYRCDPVLGAIDTPHGHVSFLQMVGLTQPEVDGLFAKSISVDALVAALEARNPMLVTDLARADNALPVPAAPHPDMTPPSDKPKGGWLKFFKRDGS